MTKILIPWSDEDERVYRILCAAEPLSGPYNPLRSIWEWAKRRILKGEGAPEGALHKS